MLIDTDAGVDDALALLLALRSPEASVQAITTVAGNVPVHLCTRNVMRVLEIAAPAVPPVVAQGAARPLRRPLTTAPEVHGKDGLGNTSRGTIQRTRVSTHDAVKVILETCRRCADRLVIVALGPLTNIARAYRRSPHTLRRVKRIVSMGGAFRVPGNTGPVAEFNYYVDPEAAHLILNAGLPVTVVPLDVTEQVVLLREEVLDRVRRFPTKSNRFVERITSFYMRYHRRTEGFEGGYLHDPIAVAVALDPRLALTEQMPVVVETSGRFTRGMSVGGIRSALPGARPVEVVSRLEWKRFLRMFHERVWALS
jgi:purine nucleosidase/pyrimidine-specific ribonucleoside hydrolase